jgi:copper chaperone CopZ
MRDRLTILVTVSVVAMLALTAYMALEMGRNIGDAIMLAPMMYAMTGGMLGGIVGGWIGGLLDEHRGAPEHESAVMVAAMALMSAMMGAMPAGMTAGMLAVMGERCIAVTAATGLALGVVSLFVMLWGRAGLGETARAKPLDRLRPVPKEITMTPSDSPSIPAADERLLQLEVRGMTCGHCAMHVSKCLLGLPGVRGVNVDHQSGRVELRHADEFPGLGKAGQALAAIGYELVGQPAA